MKHIILSFISCILLVSSYGVQAGYDRYAYGDLSDKKGYFYSYETVYSHYHPTNYSYNEGKGSYYPASYYDSSYYENSYYRYPYNRYDSYYDKNDDFYYYDRYENREYYNSNTSLGFTDWESREQRVESINQQYNNSRFSGNSSSFLLQDTDWESREQSVIQENEKINQQRKKHQAPTYFFY